MPGGPLGDVDNVKEKDCRNDKIIHKLKNWPKAENIVLKTRRICHQCVFSMQKILQDIL